MLRDILAEKLLWHREGAGSNRIYETNNDHTDKKIEKWF